MTEPLRLMHTCTHCQGTGESGKYRCQGIVTHGVGYIFQCAFPSNQTVDGIYFCPRHIKKKLKEKHGTKN